LKCRLAPEFMPIGYRRAISRRDHEKVKKEWEGLRTSCVIEGGYRLHRRTVFQVSRHFRDNIFSYGRVPLRNAGEIHQRGVERR
jgi:hypothetical protein